MDVHKCLEILWKDDWPWPFSKDRTNEKIEALEILAREGTPNYIGDIAPLLKDKSEQIRDSCAVTITALLGRVSNKNQFYSVSRYWVVTLSDLHKFYSQFSGTDLVSILIVCSSNSNGYIREEAVKKLAKCNDARAIRYLIYRLADWVEPVRNAALEGLYRFTTRQFIDDLICEIPELENLQLVERVDLSKVLVEAYEFLISDNREYVVSKFALLPENIRLPLARRISKTISTNQNEIGLLFTDKSYLVRSFAVEHLDQLTDLQISSLLNDKASKVRLLTLYKLKKSAGFTSIAVRFVADEASNVRSFARFALQRPTTEIADIYRFNIEKGQNVVGSLAGLGEINAKDYSYLVIPFLNDSRMKVQKAAFRTLAAIDTMKAYEFALKRLDCEVESFRKLIILFISRFPNSEVIELARKLYKTGDIEMRRSMLGLLSRIGGWATIPDIMLGTIDESDDIRDYSLRLLNNWRSKAATLFVAPKSGEIELAKNVLKSSFDVHEREKYFHSNPLIGMDFYFKTYPR